MFADDHERQTIYPPGPAAAPSLEEQYRVAKERLSAAQQEKMEAALELLTVRAALGRWMEEIWPGMEDGGAQRRREECPETAAEV